MLNSIKEALEISSERDDTRYDTIIINTRDGKRWELFCYHIEVAIDVDSTPSFADTSIYAPHVLPGENVVTVRGKLMVIPESRVTEHTITW